MEVLEAILGLEGTATLVWAEGGQAWAGSGEGALQDWVDFEDTVPEEHQGLEGGLDLEGLGTGDHRLLWVESTRVGLEV